MSKYYVFRIWAEGTPQYQLYRRSLGYQFIRDVSASNYTEAIAAAVHDREGTYASYTATDLLSENGTGAFSELRKNYPEIAKKVTRDVLNTY